MSRSAASEPYQRTTVVAALLRPPLTAGAPRWYVMLELALAAVLWFRLGLRHPATWVLLGLLFLGIHPWIARACRRDPWALDVLFRYLGRPVVHAGSASLRARRLPPFGSVPTL